MSRGIFNFFIDAYLVPIAIGIGACNLEFLFREISFFQELSTGNLLAFSAPGFDAAQETAGG